MNQPASVEPDRLPFLDNLRYLMVLFVLIFHAGASYATIVGFWPFHEENPIEFVDILMILIDTFMMSVLFFIAGYFCMPALQKRRGWPFLVSKLRRLGIPWLVVTALVLPVLDYVHYYAQSADVGRQPRGYASHWWLTIKKMAEFYVGPMRMSQYLDMTEHFYQRYMWFLSLLLLFFLFAWLLYEIHKRWGRTSGQPARDKAPSSRSVWVALLITGVLTVSAFAPVYLMISPNPLRIAASWFSLGNLIQFQPAKLGFYAIYFGLGIYAYSKRWFTTDGADLGRPWKWVVACLILMVASMLVARSTVRAAEPSLGQHLGFVVLYPLWTLSFLGTFTAFAFRYWNRVTPLNRELASNSYNVYLVHYVFAMTLPPLLGNWAGGPVLIKFGIVALATAVLSYGASRYVLKPHPRLAVLGLAGVSVLLAVLT